MLDYTDTHCIERELLLAKVSVLGPEYVEEQLLGGPTHEPRRHQPSQEPTDPKLEREAALAQHFEHSADPDAAAHIPAPLTPSQTLRLKSDHLQAIQVLSAQFGGHIVDVSEHSVIVEMCGKTKRVEAFLALLKPFGLLESARTGTYLPKVERNVEADGTQVLWSCRGRRSGTRKIWTSLRRVGLWMQASFPLVKHQVPRLALKVLHGSMFATSCWYSVVVPLSRLGHPKNLFKQCYISDSKQTKWYPQDKYTPLM